VLLCACNDPVNRYNVIHCPLYFRVSPSGCLPLGRRSHNSTPNYKGKGLAHAMVGTCKSGIVAIRLCKCCYSTNKTSLVKEQQCPSSLRAESSFCIRTAQQPHPGCNRVDPIARHWMQWGLGWRPFAEGMSHAKRTCLHPWYRHGYLRGAPNCNQACMEGIARAAERNTRYSCKQRCEVGRQIFVSSLANASLPELHAIALLDALLHWQGGSRPQQCTIVATLGIDSGIGSDSSVFSESNPAPGVDCSVPVAIVRWSASRTTMPLDCISCPQWQSISRVLVGFD